MTEIDTSQSAADWHTQGVAELSAALQAGRVTAQELARHFLARQQQHAELGAFLSADEATTLAQAEAADARRARGQADALTGVPLAWSDQIATEAFHTSAGSRMLASYRSPFDASVVQALTAQGMVSLGKLNVDEFGMGSSGTQSAFGPVRNPWDASRVPGGASGGSAAAVAAGLSPAAVASDSGSGLRLPAALCGLTALRPTYGRVSRFGLVAHASSLDQIGPMARSALDCAWLLSALAGPDPERDSTTLDEPATDYVAGLDTRIAGLRMGVPEELWQGLDAASRATLDAALDGLQALGAVRVPVRLPHSVHAPTVLDTVAAAEASTNLSRYDGVRFGHRASGVTDLTELYEQSRAQGFGPEVRARIVLGTHVLSQAQYASHYRQAQQVRRLMANDWQAAWASCDVIAAPVAAGPAWRADGSVADMRAAERAALAYTAPAALAGLPALSLPVGHSPEGLPLGLQLIGPYLQEQRLLNLAHAWQQTTDWHIRRPQGF